MPVQIEIIANTEELVVIPPILGMFGVAQILDKTGQELAEIFIDKALRDNFAARIVVRSKPAEGVITKSFGVEDIIFDDEIISRIPIIGGFRLFARWVEQLSASSEVSAQPE